MGTLSLARHPSSHPEVEEDAYENFETDTETLVSSQRQQGQTHWRSRIWVLATCFAIATTIVLVALAYVLPSRSFGSSPSAADMLQNRNPAEGIKSFAILWMPNAQRRWD